MEIENTGEKELENEKKATTTIVDEPNARQTYNSCIPFEFLFLVFLFVDIRSIGCRLSSMVQYTI